MLIEMKRDYNIEFFRCLCMFGVVCIHAFSCSKHVSHGLWALSCPSLIGFVMMSAWFGIHFRPAKMIRILATTFFCALIATMMSGGNYLVVLKSYWYVWAYLFLMFFSPIVDGFIQKCTDQGELVMIFIIFGGMLWGWCFISTTIFPQYIPAISGFGDSSALVLLLNYIVIRTMIRLGWIDRISTCGWMLLIIFIVSGFLVFIGFRQMHSIFAFTFVLSAFLLIKYVKLPMRRALELLSPSFFSIYLLHLPFCRYFPEYEEVIHNITHLPHCFSQFLLAIIVFILALLLDIPRRLLAFFIKRLLKW